MRLAAVLAFALLAPTVAFAGPSDDASRLLGRWQGDDGTEFELRKDGVAVFDGDSGRWEVSEPGRLRVFGEGGEIELGFSFRGERLVLSLDGEETVCTRLDAPPAPDPKPDPAPKRDPKPAPANPFSQTSDDFARIFTGDGVRLVLSRAKEGTYEGTLTFRGTEFPATARREGGKLLGEFVSEGNRFEFTAAFDGGNLVLTSGGRSFTLVAERPKAEPKNPLAGPGPKPENPLAGPTDDDPPGREPLPELSGVDPGPASRWSHPRGWYSFEMPEGWSVARQSEEGLLLNPGLKPTDTLDALITVGHGRLEAADRGMSVEKILERDEAEFRAGLAAQQIHLGEAKGPAKKVRLRDVPGVVKSWAGTTANGQSVTVWFGGLVKRDAWLTVLAIVVEGREDAFLPKVKRIFLSVAPTPPERNERVERALAGREFSHSTSEGGNFFGTTYTFRADGTVARQTLMSGPTGTGSVGGDATDSGTYEVVGDTIFLSFPDGQETARFEAGPDGGIRAILFGSKRYAAR